MEIKTEDKDELYELLERSGLGVKPVVIGIDGTNGTGKSTLGHCIGCKYGVPVVSIDQFVIEVQASYANAVNLPAIRVPISRYRNGGRTFVVEGVCLLEVLERLEIVPDVLIYLKLYNSRDEWLNEDVCGTGLNEEELNALPVLQQTIARYHVKYRPTEKASCIVRGLTR